MATGGSPPAAAAGFNFNLAMAFYRRPLPPPSVDFSSPEGKAIFGEALADGGLGCFYSLIAQFRTQDEPAYCGLSTLVMALNALAVDPGRVWKGVWRWFHEDMLDCCEPLEVVRAKGITLPQFACLARCNSASAELVYGGDASVEDFRRVVKGVAGGEDTVLVVSYSRAVLGQTGSGHFSPVGGYCAARDMVLILDVARFKLPPHWVPLSALHAAMLPEDAATGKPRGYVLLRSGGMLPPILLTITSRFLSSTSVSLGGRAAAILDAMGTWCEKPPAAIDADYVAAAAGDMMARLCRAAPALPPRGDDPRRVQPPHLLPEHRSAMVTLLEALRSTGDYAAAAAVTTTGLCDAEPCHWVASFEAAHLQVDCGTCCTGPAVTIQDCVVAMLLVCARLLEGGHPLRVRCAAQEVGCLKPELDALHNQFTAMLGVDAWRPQ